MIPIVDYANRSERLSSILGRQASFSPEIDAVVQNILVAVRESGDEAVLTFTEQFDHVRLESLRVPYDYLAEAYDEIDGELRRIIATAADNIRRFHEQQQQRSWFTDDGDGVILGQRVLPLVRVGLYVPGGTAFYPSSLLMNAIPAQVAGVEDIILVSPPGNNGRPHSLVLATAHYLGLDQVYAVGGAQAVAALAYGTESVPRVDKIVGPGNAYVATAKKMVFGPVDIDAVAGPSEIVVLADAAADAEFIAADLLSQAEHDVRASAILVTPERQLAESVREHIDQMVPTLPRQAILEESLCEYGACVITDTLEQAIEMVNDLAPEHLELMVEDPWQVMTRIKHAGAIFLGPYSSEPVGDYYAGPNHVLPTGGTARYASALSVDDFIRKQSIISYTKERLQRTGPDIVAFAESEDLSAHARAIQVRLDRS